MAGSCGAGPEGKQYKVGWRVNAEGDHLFMESKPMDEGGHRHSMVGTLRERITRRGRDPEDDEVELQQSNEQLGTMYSKFAKRRSVL